MQVFKHASRYQSTLLSGDKKCERGAYIVKVFKVMQTVCTMQLIIHAGFGGVTHSYLYTCHHVQLSTMPQFKTENINLAK